MTEQQHRPGTRPDRGAPDEYTIAPGYRSDAPSSSIGTPGEPTELSSVYESGLELEARSHWAYARKRFFRHRLAMASVILLAIILLAGVFSQRVAPFQYDELDLMNIGAAPTWKNPNPLSTENHLFGTDLLGRDYFSRVLYGIKTSARVAFLVAFLSTLIGTTIGAIAGYFGGWVDNLLMRFTDLILTLPLLAVLLVAAATIGQGEPGRVAIILALFFWTGLARIVRGTFLSLREKEFVEAAKASGSGDFRIILRHMLPNAVGPIVVNATLVIATAIIIEAALSFLGFGIKPPTPALGVLIGEGTAEMQTLWWLVTCPGLVIVAMVMCINFIGDGLRDALDPTQRRIRA